MATKPAKKADITFSVVQKSPDLFEVTSKDFLSFTGRGTTAEQALDNLLDQVNKNIDQFVRNTLVATLYKDEIEGKYKRFIEKYRMAAVEKQKDWPGILRHLQHIWRRLQPEQQKKYKVNIYLKKPVSTESLMSKLGKIDPGAFNLSKIPYPNINQKIQGQNPMFYLNEENKISLKVTNKNEEVPIHLLLDNEGNTLDDTFSFGIVVNLN